MELEKIAKITKLIKFDIFIELFSLIIFLDIFLNLFLNKNILTFLQWNELFESQNIGNVVIFVLTYGMFRLSFPILLTLLFYTAIFFIKIRIFPTQIKNNNKDYKSILEAKSIALDTSNSVLEQRIKERQEYNRKAVNLSYISVSSVLLCIVDFFIQGSIMKFFFERDGLQKFFFLGIIIIFFISLFFIIQNGYYEYWNDKIYCPNSDNKKNSSENSKI